MWTRAELKERAKGCLRRYYWAAFLVSLIFSIVSAFSGVSVDSDSMDYFSGGSSAGISGQASWRDGEFYEGEWESDVPILDEFLEDDSLSGNLSLDSAPARLFLSIVTGVVIVMAVVSALIGIFLTPVFEVGRNRFYMESRLAGRSVGVGRILWGFSNGYLKIVGTQFLKGLILFAVIFGSMLPGLILILVGVLGGLGAAGIFGLMLLLCGLFAGGCVGVWLEYGFLMTPYILSENPTMKAKEALSLSRQMMQGHKFNAFVLSLSFIGWEFLGLLLCGIGILFLLYGYFRAVEKPKVSLLLTIISLGTRVVLAYAFAPVFGVGAIWWAIPIGWALADVTGAVLLNLDLRGSRTIGETSENR